MGGERRGIGGGRVDGVGLESGHGDAGADERSDEGEGPPEPVFVACDCRSWLDCAQGEARSIAARVEAPTEEVGRA